MDNFHRINPVSKTLLHHPHKTNPNIKSESVRIDKNISKGCYINNIKYNRDDFVPLY